MSPGLSLPPPVLPEVDKSNKNQFIKQFFYCVECSLYNESEYIRTCFLLFLLYISTLDLKSNNDFKFMTVFTSKSG